MLAKATKEFNHLANLCEFDTTYDLLSWGDTSRFPKNYTIADLVERAKDELIYLLESDMREDLKHHANKIRKFIKKWKND